MCAVHGLGTQNLIGSYLAKKNRFIIAITVEQIYGLICTRTSQESHRINLIFLDDS